VLSSAKMVSAMKKIFIFILNCGLSYAHVLSSSVNLEINSKLIFSAFLVLNFCFVRSNDLITRLFPLTKKYLPAASTWKMI
jgi:hypothetical protein